LDATKRFAESIADEYPTRQEFVNYNVSIAAQKTSVSAAGAGEQMGFICRSEKRPQVVQARTDAFLFARLEPYEKWEPFRDEARRLWHIFFAFVPRVAVHTIGVRYINLISLPQGRRLEDYLNIYPEAKTRELSFQSLLMRLEIPLDARGGIIILQEALAPPVKPNSFGLVLDIDVRVPRDPSVPLWDQVDSLRPVKNQFFEESLTPLAKEDFNAESSL
jgi:uncharacterized protein (TIGR04255 family)